jgi:hypothetical protein
MVGRCEHEAEAELVDRLRDALGGELELEPELLEHVGAAGERRDRAIAVLRDACAGRRRDERGGGRDVERLAAVATRAGGVDEIVALRVDRNHVRAHGLGRAGDLVGRLAPSGAVRRGSRRSARVSRRPT